MGLNILKNVSVSALILFFIGCEDNRIPEREESYFTYTLSVEPIGSIDLNEYSWQTLRTVWGQMSSEGGGVCNVRVEWSSNMYWVVGDTSGYFKTDCRTCNSGIWYDTDGTTEYMSYDFHTMAPVTNQVSMVNDEGLFGNVLAPVSAMKGDAMWLWWNVGTAYIDSMLIVLE